MGLKFLSLLTSIFFLTTFPCLGNIPWTDAAYRKSHYPEDTFYVSYHSLINENGNLNECIARAVTEVQAMLANSIHTHVSSETKSSISSINSDQGYSETETFFNDFSAASSAHLVNVHVEHFYEETSKTVHALAYVKKDDLLNFCQSKITYNLETLDKRINEAETLISQGYKKQAKDIVKDLPPLLVSTPSYIDQLIVLGGNNKNSEYSSLVEEYSSKVAKLLADMTHNIQLYIHSDVKDSYGIEDKIGEKCKGILANQGFAFVDSPEVADYVLTIFGKTRDSNSSSGPVRYAYADIDMEVVRGRDGANIYSDSFSVKGGSSTEEKAHYRALSDVPEEICEKFVIAIKE